MSTMTSQAFSERIKTGLGPRLKSVILFGSAASGDHAGKRSDYNVLVVLDRLGLEELKVLSPLVRLWVKSGNPTPLLFTSKTLEKSVDAFPLEFAGIKESHHVLFGEDVVRDITVRTDSLYMELEHELKGKLMQLRGRYLMTQDQPAAVTELMIRSLSTFLTLFRGALRLYQREIPVKKLEALAALATHISIDTGVFETIVRLKAGEKVQGAVPDKLFAQYLQAIESVVEAVDTVLHSKR